MQRVIARGAVRRGSFVSSESSAALSNPYITYAAMSIDARNGQTLGPSPCTPLVRNTTAGPRMTCVNRMTSTTTTPMISIVTPVRVIAATS